MLETNLYVSRYCRMRERANVVDTEVSSDEYSEPEHSVRLRWQLCLAHAYAVHGVSAVRS